jgi:hypothetical protein
MLHYRLHQITLEQRGARKPPSALPRSETVTYGIRKIASFLACRAHCGGIACDEGRLSLLDEDLAQSPAVPEDPGKVARFG